MKNSKTLALTTKLTDIETFDEINPSKPKSKKTVTTITADEIMTINREKLPASQITSTKY